MGFYFLFQMFNIFAIEVSVFGEAFEYCGTPFHQSLYRLCLIKVVINFPLDCVFIHLTSARLQNFVLSIGESVLGQGSNLYLLFAYDKNDSRERRTN